MANLRLNRFSSIKSPRNIGTLKGFTIAAAVLAILFTAPALWFRYEDQKLQKQLDNIQVPSTWLVQKTVRDGNVLCLDACPSISRTYAGNFNDLNAKDFFTSTIIAHGYEISAQPKCPIAGVSIGSVCNVSGIRNGMTISMNLAKTSNGQVILISISHVSYFWGLAKEK